MKQAIVGRIVIGAIAWIASAQASVANLASPSIQSAVINSSSLSQTWSEKAIQGLATEFNCGQNYPQANQQTIRSATRYELAATLHHCLQAMHSKKAIANNLSTLQQLQTEFRKELDTLRGTVDTLDLEVNNREEMPTSTSKSPTKNTEKEVIAPRQVKLSPQSSAEQLYFGYKNQADFLTSFQTQTTQSEIKPHPIHQNLAQQINSASKKTYPSVGGPENQKPSPIQILQQQQLDLLPNLALASDTPSLTQGINPNLDNVTVQAEFQPTEQLKFSGAIGYSLTESPNQRL